MNEIPDVIKKKLNQAINLLGGISDIYTSDNRAKLHKAYELLWEVRQYFEKGWVIK